MFAEPWEATAFALVVNLAQAGHYSWQEWVEYFSREIASAKEEELAGRPTPSYYEHWLAAAEKLMVAKGLASREQLAAKRFGLAANRACQSMKWTN